MTHGKQHDNAGQPKHKHALGRQSPVPSSNATASSSEPLQPNRSAGRLQPTGRTGASNETRPSVPQKSLSNALSHKRSASSLASSLITSLSSGGGSAVSTAADNAATAPSSTTPDPAQGNSSSSSSAGATLPSIGSRTASGTASAFTAAGAVLGAFSQAAAATVSSSRPHSRHASLGAPAARSYSPVQGTPPATGPPPATAAVGAGATSRASSAGLAGRAGTASSLLREGSALSIDSGGGSSSFSPTPTARSFTDQGASTALSGSGLKSKGSAGQQLPPLPPLSNPGVLGSCSLEGGKTVLFKEAAVKFLDPLGQPLPVNGSSSSAGSSAYSTPAVQFLSTTGGSTASAPDWGTPLSSNFSINAPGGSKPAPETARSRSKVSFQLAPARVSFLNSIDGSPVGGPSTSGPSTTEPANTAGSSAGSKAGSRHGSTGGQSISTAAGQLSHTQVMRGSVVGVPQSGAESPQQSADTVAGQTHGKGRRSVTTGSETGHSMAEGLKGGLKAIANKFKQLALVLAEGSDNGSSEMSPGSCTSDGESLSISPVPTPKDGNSVVRAVAYKQHHGYLPTPHASSAGGMSFKMHSGAGAAVYQAGSSSLSRPSITTLSRAGSMSLSRAGSMSLSRADSTSLCASRASSKSVSRANSTKLLPEEGGSNFPADESAQAWPSTGSGAGMLSTAGRAVADAAGGALLPQGSSTASLMPLPPGAVPVFGGTAAAGAASESSSSNDSSSIRQPGSGPDGVIAGSSSVQQGSSSGSQSLGVAGKAGPLKLGPANLPGPLLLAVSPWLPRALQRDHWCLADFAVQKKVYDGYASTICKAKDRKSGLTLALKLYRMHKLNDISSHQVAREVRLHIGLQHENIIDLYAAWQEAGNVVLVQEFAGHGDLWSFIDSNSGRLTERVTVSLVLQPFLRGLQFLHSAGIAHRDIKPENVLFGSNMTLKLADFGLAVNLREEPAVTRVGTLDYMAPEVLRCPLKRHPGDNKDRPELHYATAVDTWAVGVLAYELLTGRAPFTAAGASDASIQSAICTAAPAFPSRMSEPAKQFITAALNKLPSARPTVLQMLQHPWIRSFQRSHSTARAEPRTSQELGGTGRLLMPSKSVKQAEPPALNPGTSLPVRPPDSSTAADSPALARSGSSGAAPAVHRQPSLHKQPSLRTVSSGRGLSGGVSTSQAAVAAAAVWNSDDNGLTGYATGSTGT